MRRLLVPVMLAATLAVPATAPAQLDTEDADSVIELRRETMAALWERLDRLSAFVTRAEPAGGSGGDAIVLERQGMDPREVYALVHGTEAERDARDIADLLSHARQLWPYHTNRAWYGETNAEPVIWVVPNAFERYFDESESAAESLVEALAEGRQEPSQRAVCLLSQACGRCHSVFRRVAHQDLMLEGRGWTGNYATCREIIR